MARLRRQIGPGTTAVVTGPAGGLGRAILAKLAGQVPRAPEEER